MINSTNKFRNDIQGLRGIAVILVLLYHVFPNVVPGGFIGVDVFFVISGFLICGHILNEGEKTGKCLIANFYSRRILRLLPAACTVLIFIGLGTFFVLPPTRWHDTASEILASIFYLENMYLHNQSINYLTADKLPSPTQHFWSLSVEEQFYIIWPIIFTIQIVLSNKLKLDLRRVTFSILAFIFGLSLYTSFSLTSKDPSAAYFHTFTRVWEISLGGMLTIIPQIRTFSEKLKKLIVWLGLILVLVPAVYFSKQTAFPGLAALIPTFGVALILWGGNDLNSPERDLVQKLLESTPLMFVGGISYSLYLWHWPLVIFAKDGLNLDLNGFIGINLIVLSIVLAWVTKVMIEDPFRVRKNKATTTKTFLFGGILMMASALPAIFLLHQKPPSIHKKDTIKFLGANALLEQEYYSSDINQEFIPVLDTVRTDVASVYEDKCHVARPGIDLIPCIYIPVLNSDGTRNLIRVKELPDRFDKPLVMLVGDSHAAQWLPALKLIALEQNFAIISHTKSSCAFIDKDLIVGGAIYPECRRWGIEVLNDIISRRPTFIVTSMVTNHFVAGSKSSSENRQNLAEGLSSFWDKLQKRNIQVFAINGTPRFQTLVPDCVSKNLIDWEKCNLARSEAMKYGGVMEIATSLSRGAHFVDMTDFLCTSSVCPVIVGNILVYRDQHHITATYVKTMSPYLRDKLYEKR